MQVLLSPRYILMLQGDAIFLKDRQADTKIWPEDVFEPFPNWGFRPAAEHARRMARAAMLKPAQRELVDRFCASLPAPRPEEDTQEPDSLRVIDP